MPVFFPRFVLTTAVFCAAVHLSAQDGSEPPRTWIDPDTGHRVVRLTNEPGSASLYFNQNGYTADGKEDGLHHAGGHLGSGPGDHAAHAVVKGKRARLWSPAEDAERLLHREGDKVFATDVDSGATREIATLPARGSVATVNADETLLAGTYIEGNGQDYNANRPQRPQSFTAAGARSTQE